MNNFLSKKENMLYLTILLLSFLGTQNYHYSQLLMFWILAMLIIGNARKFGYQAIGRYIIRILCYFVPYTFVVNYLDLAKELLLTNKVLFCCMLSLIISTFMLYLQRDQIKFQFSKAILLSRPKLNCWQYPILSLCYLFGAVCEELFYRSYILNLSTGNMLILVILSEILFFLSHYLTPWSNQFSNKDYFRQIITAMLSCLLYLVSKSILPSLVLHIVLNLPYILVQVKLYYFFFIEKNEYSESDIFDNLDL